MLSVQGTWNYFGPKSCALARKHDLPYVVWPQGVFDPWALRHHWIRKRLFWLAFSQRDYQRAAAVVASTRIEAEQVRAVGVKTRIEVIPNGVDPGEFEEYESREALEDRFPALRGRRIVLYLARFHRKKGLEQLVPAWREVIGAHPDALLVLAGPDDRGYKPQVERMVRECGLGGSALLLEMVTGPTRAGLLRAADVFVLPSYSEGLPMGVLEAMVCGRPVVITPYCNLPEVSEAGAGLTVEPRRAGLAAAINDLLADDEARRQMGENGLRLVKERFTWEQVARQTEALCLDIINQRK